MKPGRQLRSYRDLRIWQDGIQLVTTVYGLTSGFPKHELCGLTGQIRRAAVSVPSNIAEGYLREHRKEYLHFLSISQGSLGELDTQFEIAFQLGYMSEPDHRRICSALSSEGKQLRSLRKSLGGRA